MKKMYIAVLDEAPDYMVPTLVAHSILNAHKNFSLFDVYAGKDIYPEYLDWLENSFRKVVLRVNRKEYDKIKDTLTHWEGYENTICEGKGSCLIILPVETDAIPNVLKFAKMWKPKEVV
ncbi:hypothetical protein PHB09_095 [Pseudomonas phage PHB09]|uniref:Uncharacterized protein n=1 Tax=Pseudomonas phage PHB09 TaxID=2867265 RepID=A0AAE8XCA3_9CAUD|nr:hypothetical protein QGX10_gp095 [Pseudomonas phage PHB09]UAV84591.1 hypothetical protein PHB09_095 [Pseudomonas phage PHB09]